MAIAQHSTAFGRLRPLRSVGSTDFRSDKYLVRAAQSGRSEAASVLIERHYPRVFSFISYLTSGRGSAEDLTQEVFTKALTSLGAFNGRYQFEPWLIRIARNLVIDESRKNVHRASPTDPEDLVQLEAVPPDSDNVWNSLSQQLAGDQVKGALSKMPLRQRTALVLREIEDMSYADIAQVLGTNVRGVEGTLRRAKARFRLEASAAEGSEGQQAVCKRALRLVALDGESPGSEADRHLKDCAECRTKSRSLKSSDGLFAVLPAIALVGKPAWTQAIVAKLAAPQAMGWAQRLVASLKTASGTHASGPVAQALQVAGAVAMAGTVSVTAFSGYQQVQEDIISPPAVVSPAFSQEFAAAPQDLIAALIQVQKSAQKTFLLDEGASGPATPVKAPALVTSVVSLLASNLPSLPADLSLDSKLNLLSELPAGSLAELARTMNLPASTSKEDLLAALKTALAQTPATGSIAKPVTNTPLPEVSPPAKLSTSSTTEVTSQTP